MKKSLIGWERIFALGKKAAKKAGIKSEDEVNKIVQEYRRSKKIRV